MECVYEIRQVELTVKFSVNAKETELVVSPHTPHRRWCLKALDAQRERQQADNGQRPWKAALCNRAETVVTR